MFYKLIVGDCLDVMRTMEPNSVDAIVCDPPYGLSFMGKDWDHGVPGVQFWREALRVAKPGAHLLAFGGTRTFHRLAVAIEDAGWEIRDTIMWVYAQGFPKSHDVSKAIDKAAGETRERIRGVRSGVVRGTYAQDEWSKEFKDSVLSPNPITSDAARWQGWGTSLKPSFEPIIVARKPLQGTVAQNVLTWGTGAINVDGCRVAAEPELAKNWQRTQSGRQGIASIGLAAVDLRGYTPSGRWPANVIHDGSDEVLGLMPQSGNGHFPGERTARTDLQAIYGGGKGLPRGTGTPEHYMNDAGSAARFFYCAKASKADRDEGCEGLGLQEKRTRNSYGGQADYDCPDGAHRVGNKGTHMAHNHHPTVKPTALMRWLVRLVTPPGGTVLDPFMGSGSTGKAAALEGFGFIGIDTNPEYVEIARRRIAAVELPLLTTNGGGA